MSWMTQLVAPNQVYLILEVLTPLGPYKAVAVVLEVGVMCMYVIHVRTKSEEPGMSGRPDSIFILHTFRSYNVMTKAL